MFGRQGTGSWFAAPGLSTPEDRPGMLFHAQQDGLQVLVA